MSKSLKKSSRENLPKIKFQLQKPEPITKPSQEHNSKNSVNSSIQKNKKAKALERLNEKAKN